MGTRGRRIDVFGQRGYIYIFKRVGLCLVNIEFLIISTQLSNDLLDLILRSEIYEFKKGVNIIDCEINKVELKGLKGLTGQDPQTLGA